MKTRISWISTSGRAILCLLVFVLLPPSASLAFMDEADLEKPKPVFSREGGVITAKLIPRAKSTSITIAFEASTGGRLSSVSAFDITKALGPQINRKNFRSELFLVDIQGITPGGEAVLTAASSFFTSSTTFWIFNENSPERWMDAKARNIPLSDKVQQFVITIKDGGPMDFDGAADGRVTVVGGPCDSFWGYVLGTLFIRFFGVFIVLAVLMMGMMLSGFVFQKLEKKPGKKRGSSPLPPPKAAPPKPAAPPAPPAGDVSPEMAAAIGLALALHLAPRTPAVHDTPTSAASSWAVEGRRRMMADRSLAFHRIKP